MENSIFDETNNKVKILNEEEHNNLDDTDDLYEFYLICHNCGEPETTYYCKLGVPITNKMLLNTKCVCCECSGYLLKDYKLSIPVRNNNSTSNNNSSSDDDSCILPAMVGFGIGTLF